MIGGEPYTLGLFDTAGKIYILMMNDFFNSRNDLIRSRRL
jgi:hypothetical protein